jgi:arylformamidase
LKARITVGHREIGIDLSKPISLAIGLDFSELQPRHFGAPAATSLPFSVPGFSGSVAQGASCNCQVLTLNPHCNGTHTECVGHLTRERADAYKIIPPGLVPTLLLSIEPNDAAASGETTAPVPQRGDRLISRRSLQERWREIASGPSALAAGMARQDATAFEARGLVIRTLPNRPEKRHQDYSNQTPPYLSREAAEWLVERGIEHLVVDLPSIDRAHDEGRLTAHRIFFGLPRESAVLSEATRASSTVTELAYIPDALVDGQYMLELQAPALAGDAVPSRPLLYRLSAA